MKCERTEPLPPHTRCNKPARYDVVYQIATVRDPFGRRLCLEHRQELHMVPLLQVLDEKRIGN
jgi:hypothetical protein